MGARNGRGQGEKQEEKVNGQVRKEEGAAHEDNIAEGGFGAGGGYCPIS